MNWLMVLLFWILFYMHLETRFLSTTKVSLSKIENSEQDLIIAHLSDIHIGKMFVAKALIRYAIIKNKPNCIVLTGDYIEKESHIDKFINFIAYINPHKLPVFIVWGNHDHKLLKNDNLLKEFNRKFAENGITLLQNNNITLHNASKKYSFIGVDELFYGNPNIDKAFANIDNMDYKVVLTHNPDMIFNILDKNFDLLLCGHFHGGQIYMPFHFEFKMLRNEKLAKMKVISGLYYLLDNKIYTSRGNKFRKFGNIDAGCHCDGREKDDCADDCFLHDESKAYSKRAIYINRGLGNVLLPFRFLSPPEIAFIRIP